MARRSATRARDRSPGSLVAARRCHGLALPPAAAVPRPAGPACRERCRSTSSRITAACRCSSSSRLGLPPASLLGCSPAPPARAAHRCGRARARRRCVGATSRPPPRSRSSARSPRQRRLRRGGRVAGGLPRCAARRRSAAPLGRAADRGSSPGAALLAGRSPPRGARRAPRGAPGARRRSSAGSPRTPSSASRPRSASRSESRSCSPRAGSRGEAPRLAGRGRSPRLLVAAARSARVQRRRRPRRARRPRARSPARHDFDAPGDPAATPRVLLARRPRCAGDLRLRASSRSGSTALAADRPFTLGFALARDARGAARPRASAARRTSAGAFGDWFPLSVFLAGLVGAAWLAAGLARAVALPAPPGGARAGPRPRARRRLGCRHARAVRAARRQVVLLRERRARVPGLPGRRRASRSSRATRSGRRRRSAARRPVHRASPRARGWRIAILGASERCLDALPRRTGCRRSTTATRRCVETASFSLEGRAIRKVRQSVHRLERAGYRARGAARRARSTGELRAELELIAREWRGAEPRAGLRDGARRALPARGRGRRSSSSGSTRTARRRASSTSPSRRAGGALSLSSMPRLRTTPNGFNEWLDLRDGRLGARAHGYARISLNFAPFAALLAPEAELDAAAAARAAARSSR